MARDGWTAARVREFAQLRGRQITSWIGVEMALREEGADGGPQFADPAVPCLQLLTLRASFADGTLVTVGTYQDDCGWGLWLRDAASDHSAGLADAAGIFRMRVLSGLPTGEVGSVETFLDVGVLAEVVLRVQGRPLLLIAGEMHEDIQARLVFTRCDESVLVFTDPLAAESLDWVPERRGLIQS
jgi:hypothetical protein